MRLPTENENVTEENQVIGLLATEGLLDITVWTSLAQEFLSSAFEQLHQKF